VKTHSSLSRLGSSRKPSNCFADPALDHRHPAGPGAWTVGVHSRRPDPDPPGPHESLHQRLPRHGANRRRPGDHPEQPRTDSGRPRTAAAHPPGEVLRCYPSATPARASPPRSGQRIFDPYFTTKETVKGTGMGLSIVHGIVAEYGGFISCESEPGTGRPFHIFLPIPDAEALAGKPIPQRHPRAMSAFCWYRRRANAGEMGQTMLEAARLPGNCPHQQL
jgi:hypothetical protein